jgi:hypothetical protein
VALNGDWTLRRVWMSTAARRMSVHADEISQVLYEIRSADACRPWMSYEPRERIPAGALGQLREATDGGDGQDGADKLNRHV